MWMKEEEQIELLDKVVNEKKHHLLQPPDPDPDETEDEETARKIFEQTAYRMGTARLADYAARMGISADLIAGLSTEVELDYDAALCDLVIGAYRRGARLDPNLEVVFGTPDIYGSKPVKKKKTQTTKTQTVKEEPVPKETTSGDNGSGSPTMNRAALWGDEIITDVANIEGGLTGDIPPEAEEQSTAPAEEKNLPKKKRGRPPKQKAEQQEHPPEPEDLRPEISAFEHRVNSLLETEMGNAKKIAEMASALEKMGKRLEAMHNLSSDNSQKLQRIRLVLENFIQGMFTTNLYAINTGRALVAINSGVKSYFEGIGKRAEDKAQALLAHVEETLNPSKKS